MDDEKRITPLRQSIEAVDTQILHLLNKRAEIVLELGKIKTESKIDFYDPKREKEILESLVLENSGPFPDRAILPVFQEIISACRSLETELTVVYLGPPATHTHLACITHFGSSIRAIARESIEEVFEAVEKEKANYGVVPIENSTEGSVNRTLDMFIDSEVKICGEVLIRVSHDLLSGSGNPQDIRKIYSHPHAFEQCRKWLKKNFHDIPLVGTASTARAAQMATEDPSSAAIASSFAARLYGLKVIVSQIEDSLHNCTRFLVFGRQFMEKTGRDKTSILFSIPHTPGSLFRVLKPFAEKGINLTKIESRPVKNKPWEYIFFLDFEGHATDMPIREIMVELEKNLIFMKLLGSYPGALKDRELWRL